MKVHTCKTIVDETRGLVVTETPRWHGDKLWFVDIFQNRIKTVDLEGNLEIVAELPFAPNGWGFKRDGENPNVKAIAARRDAAMPAFAAGVRARFQAAG
jgi:sugar lactone lactonase YvrE